MPKTTHELRLQRSIQSFTTSVWCKPMKLSPLSLVSYDRHDCRNRHHRPKIWLDYCDDPDDPWFAHDRCDCRNFYGWMHQSRWWIFCFHFCCYWCISRNSESISSPLKIACYFLCFMETESHSNLRILFVQETDFSFWGIVYSVSSHNILVLWLGFLWKHCEFLAKFCPTIKLLVFIFVVPAISILYKQSYFCTS